MFQSFVGIILGKWFSYRASNLITKLSSSFLPTQHSNTMRKAERTETWTIWYYACSTMPYVIGSPNCLFHHLLHYQNS